MKTIFNPPTFIMLPLMALFLLLAVVLAEADQKDSEDVERIRTELVKMIPPAATAEINPTPVKGVYRLQVQGNFAYAYVDGDHLLIGDLYNTKDKENLGEIAQAEATIEKLQTVSTDSMIVYGPKDAKRHVTIFTDIDCGYCRKLHVEVPELNKAGVQVRYLAFPRAGVGSDSYKKYVSVWCNADQQTALTDAKNGKNVPTATCDNPVEENFRLGRQVGVRGTPMIVIDDGTIAPGYVPYKELLKRMGVEAGGS